MDKAQMRETEYQLVDNKLMLEKVDKLLGKRTDIEKYIAGDQNASYRGTARQRNLDVSESLASLDISASVALTSMRDDDVSVSMSRQRPGTAAGKTYDYDIVSLADSEIDRMYRDIDTSK